MGSNPILWSSKKKKKKSTIATLIMEAEYIGTSECTNKCLVVRNIVYELFKNLINQKKKINLLG